jgi:hypothetical protein
MGSGAEIFNAVINQGGTPAMLSNTLALRPAFGYRGRIFIATDTREIYRDTGTSWELISSGGGSVNIYNSDGTLTGNRTVTAGSNDLTFNYNVNADKYLQVKNLSNGGFSQGGIGIYANTSNGVFIAKTSSGFGGFQNVAANDGVLINVGGKFNFLSNGAIEFGVNGISTIRNFYIFSSGRFGFNTSTDAGFLADINGTVRIQNTLTMANISGSQLMNLTGNTFNGTLINITHNAGATGTGISYVGSQVQRALFLSTSSPVGLANANFVLNEGSVTYGHYGSSGMGSGFIYNVSSTNTNTSVNSTLWGGKITATSNASGTTVKGLEITSNSTSGKNIAIETLNGENNYYHAANLTSSNFADRNIWTSHSRLTQTLSAGADQAGAGYYVGGLHIREISASGANTYGNATINAGGASTLQIDFTGAGTLTASQSGLRAFAGHQIFNTFGGSASGTITHFAGIQILGLYNRNSGTITPTITNAYGLIINNLNDYSHTFTLTNRWGIYQTGGSDNNYLAGKLLVGTNTVTARQVHIAGDMEFTTTLSGTSGSSSGQHLIVWVNGTQYKIDLRNA